MRHPPADRGGSLRPKRNDFPNIYVAFINSVSSFTYFADESALTLFQQFPFGCYPYFRNIFNPDAHNSNMNKPYKISKYHLLFIKSYNIPIAFAKRTYI